MSKKLKVIDLFAGVGGLSFGFAHDNDFEIIAANEILPKMAKAYELNHPGVKMYCKDVKEFGIKDLQKQLNTKNINIDVIVGGPPCQAYSTVGKRLIDDPRGKLFQEYYRVLKEVNPKMFVFENVKGLLSMAGGELIKTIVELFKTLGYKTEYKLLNAADFGAPQIRERVIIVGTKSEYEYEFPRPQFTDPKKAINSNLKPYITLGQAIGDLPIIPNIGSNRYNSEPQNEFQKMMRQNTNNIIEDHSISNNNPKLIELMMALPEGGGPKDLPEDIRPKSGFGNSYSRLWWERPSTTITRNLGTPSSARCIHPLAPRALTTREGARLQGFPDDYKFYGSRAEKNLQIGNAVSPFLSKALSESIKKYLLE